MPIGRAFADSAGSAQGRVQTATLDSSDRGASPVGMSMGNGCGGFDWGSLWCSMTTDQVPA